MKKPKISIDRDKIKQEDALLEALDILNEVSYELELSAQQMLVFHRIIIKKLDDLDKKPKSRPKSRPKK